MKVLILNTFNNGGAAVAARRLQVALEKQNHQVNFLSFYPERDSEFLLKNKTLNKLLFIFDRLQTKLNIARKNWLYRFCSGYFGLDITQHKLFKDSDIVHIHWVHFGYLSIKQIAKITRLKPTVWTLHDMWAFTGGCHYALDCQQFKSDCASCFYLKPKYQLSAKVLKKKLETPKYRFLNIITCSNWLGNKAKQSLLFRENESISTIPNTLNSDRFKPLNKKKLRAKYNLDVNRVYILSGAMDFSDERKGFTYLKEAFQILIGQDPDIGFLTFGKSIEQDLGIEMIHLGMISSEEQITEIYNLANIFVLPSIQDNLPNTVLEALACGLPVVSFRSGGVEDMIDHLQNGYLAENMNSSDLAQGILQICKSADYELYAENARKKVEASFSEELIAKTHINLYKKLIRDFKH